MRVLTVLLFLAATSCGQTAVTSIDGGGDDADTGLGDSGGNPDNRLSGPMSPSGPVSCYCSTLTGSPGWACPI
jgi:hypothetical protein